MEVEIRLWDMFKAVELNEVSKRMDRERGEEASEHSSIGERPAELAKRAACGEREAGQRVSLGAKEESVSSKRDWSAVSAVE